MDGDGKGYVLAPEPTDNAADRALRRGAVAQGQFLVRAATPELCLHSGS
jgi:hypothetical protein